jgi:hypothetical protein
MEQLGVVVKPFAARSPSELSLAVGDRIILEGEWLRATPGQLVRAQKEAGGAQGMVPAGLGLYAIEYDRARLVSQFTAEHESELTCGESQIITLLRLGAAEATPEGWVLATHSGRVGFVPASYTQPVKSGSSTATHPMPTSVSRPASSDAPEPHLHESSIKLAAHRMMEEKKSNHRMVGGVVTMGGPGGRFMIECRDV